MSETKDVRVKALKWTDDKAPSSIGTYSIEEHGGSIYLRLNRATIERCSSSEAAIAAAEADHRRRIISDQDVRELDKAAVDVLAERDRQKTVEGWTLEHDDEHSDGELAKAAACYALGSDRINYVERLGMRGHIHQHRVIWPWSSEWWRPKDRRNDLVRAGALILAEIERLDRLSKHGGDR